MRWPWQSPVVVPTVVAPAYRMVSRNVLDSQVRICAHCGGVHIYRCPRILRATYGGEDGDLLLAVEYDPIINAQLWRDVVWVGDDQE